MIFADHLPAMPYLSPRGRNGARTALGGAYEVTRGGTEALPYLVRHGASRTLCASLSGALDAVIAHRQTGGNAWTLDGTRCPARSGTGTCTLLRGDHRDAVSGDPAPRVWHRAADGREWRGMAA